jgi:hypothetical protein
MEISQSGHHESDELLVCIDIELLLEEGNHLCIARFTVAALPCERGGRIETVGKVTLEVVNEYFSGELLDFEPLFDGLGEPARAVFDWLHDLTTFAGSRSRS